MTQSKRKKVKHKIYAGIYGKVIGVHIGKNAENLDVNDIYEQYGSSSKYIESTIKNKNNFYGVDDDISGTFIHLNNFNKNTTRSSLNISKNLLENIIINKTTFWWGGLNNSTENTAVINLINGVKPPLSGSEKLNGSVVSNQIGGRIFNDIWGLIYLNNPNFAKLVAKRYSRITHDKLALESGIFWSYFLANSINEKTIIDGLKKSLKTIGFSFYLKNEIIKMINLKENKYSFDQIKYEFKKELSFSKQGHCHIYPNDVRLFMSLICGNGKLIKSLEYLIDLGEDTDSNAGNLGCAIGVYYPNEILKQFNIINKLNDRVIVSSINIENSITSITELTNKILSIQLNDKISTSKNEFNFDYRYSTHNFKIKKGKFLPDDRKGLFIENKNGEVAIEIFNHFYDDEVKLNSYKAYSLPIIEFGQKLVFDILDKGYKFSQLNLFYENEKKVLNPLNVSINSKNISLGFQLPVGYNNKIKKLELKIFSNEKIIKLSKFKIKNNPKFIYNSQFTEELINKNYSINNLDNVNIFSKSFLEISNNFGFGFINFSNFQKNTINLKIKVGYTNCKSFSLLFNFRSIKSFNEIRFQDKKFFAIKNNKIFRELNLKKIINYNQDEGLITVKLSKKNLSDFFIGTFGIGVTEGTVSIKEIISI